MKLLFQQDDRAPDSLVAFRKRLVEETGNELVSFWINSKRKETDMCITYTLGGYMVEICADDPLYKLYKLE